MPIYPDGTEINSGGGGGATYLGDIREFISLGTDLPIGWVSLSGEGYLLTSKLGKKLLEVKNTQRWKNLEAIWVHSDNLGLHIRIVGDLIYLPDWKAPDGRMPITRPVDGMTRKVGTLQQDAIREIAGELYGSLSSPNGCFYVKTSNSKSNAAGSYPGAYPAAFSAAKVVPTASENLMLNRGTTIAINLND